MKRNRAWLNPCISTLSNIRKGQLKRIDKFSGRAETVIKQDSYAHIIASYLLATSFWEAQETVMQRIVITLKVIFLKKQSTIQIYP